MNSSLYDCIIIGGGAAGLMCAATAAKRGRKVVILDHANKIGKKILMSGGGRCNFTNLFIDNDNYICTNNHFFKSALSRYTQYDFLNLVDKYKLNYHEKESGQLFCDHKASDILNILVSECESSGVTILTHCTVDDIRSKNTAEATQFTLTTSKGVFQSESLVVATGGLSIPTMGATGFGYQIARQFGLQVLPQQAALVPFTLEPALRAHCIDLAGLSLPIAISCNDKSFQGPLLFTHKGISGPAVLQISNYWNPGSTLTVDFFPNLSLNETLMLWRQDSNKSDLSNLLAQIIPKRFVALWLNLLFTDFPQLQKRCADLSNDDIDKIAQHFHQWTFLPSGTEGYKTAEVTLGGINTDEVSSKTFEAKKCSGLYFIGEVVDVTGWLGGFNFQWAWASGFCAGQYI